MRTLALSPERCSTGCMTKVFRVQLLGAIAAGFAIGCKAETPPATPDPAPRAAARVDEEERAEVAVAASPSAAIAPAAAPVPSAPQPRTCEPSTKKQQYCLGVRKAPSKPMQQDPPIEYEANGCAAASSVNDMCSNRRVLSGPVLRGAQCCYQICKGMEAPCGRLLLDERGDVRVAAATVGSGWGSALVTALPAAARQGWLADALLEHASVAAFSRFALELLAIGAPARFVEDAHRAALDEIEHARLCFALASEPGSPRAPAPLSLVGLPIREHVADVVRAAAEECCCGETLAAEIAAHALVDCTHPEARRALERIAADEARHAELGWRFVAWAVAHHGEAALEAARQGIDAGLARLGTASAPTESLSAYGRLSRSDLAQLLQSVRRDLIEPLRAALAA